MAGGAAAGARPAEPTGGGPDAIFPQRRSGLLLSRTTALAPSIHRIRQPSASTEEPAMNPETRHGIWLEENLHVDERNARTEPSTRRGARWVVVALVAVALATPLLLYRGPDVMYPAAPVIADEALEGHLSLHAYTSRASDEPAALQ
jgi:hypothetical protein